MTDTRPTGELPELFPPTDDVPAPADALVWADWYEHDVCDWRRYFTVSERHIEGPANDPAGFTVVVAGLQHRAGTVERWGHVAGEGELSAAGLRRLAAACLDAADALDATAG